MFSAGQECPTVSGIPLGLGGLRIIDKDKNNERHNKPPERRRSKDGKEKEKGKGPDSSQSPAAIIISEPSESVPDVLLPIPAMPVLQHTPSHHGHTSGWSWILESWFCHGLGSRAGRDDSTPGPATSNLNVTNIPPNTEPRARSASMDETHRSESPHFPFTPGGRDGRRKKDKHLHMDQGPYELIAKERLMGIYVAVFIYKDLKPLSTLR